MSIVEKIKNGYYFFEDKYYAMLDAIAKHIPIYKIIDPIDKVFPSFILFLIIIAAIIILLLWFFLGGISFGPYNAKIFVTEEGNSKIKIEGAKIEISLEEQIVEGETDENGSFTLEIPQQEMNALISVEKTGYVSQADEDITLSTSTPLTIRMKKAAPPPPKKHTITIKDYDTGGLITTLVTVTFHCSGNATPPQERTTTSGTIQDVQPSGNCSRLTADFSADGYEPEIGVPISKESETIRMVKKKGNVEVTVKDPSGNVESAIVTLLKNSFDMQDTGITSYSGDYLFTGVAPGTYTISAEADDGARQETSEEFEVTEGETTTVTITLGPPIPRDEQEKIFVKIKDFETGEAISGATIIVYSQNTPIAYDVTDSYGEFSTNIDKTKSHSMAIKKEGYVTKILSPAPTKKVDDTEPTEIAITPLSDSPANYGSIMAHVFNEENKAIENAEVFIISKRAPGLIINHPKSLTNEDGNVTIGALEAGDYNVRVKNGEALSAEVSVKVENGKTTFVNIKLIVAQGIVPVKVIEKNSLPIGGATVTFYNASTKQQIASCTTATTGSSIGKCSSTAIKVTTNVYAKATAEGYLPSFTPVITIAKTNAEMLIELETTTSNPEDAKIIVKFDSLCADRYCKTKTNTIDSAQTTAGGTAAGPTTYYAKINLVLPADADYENVLEHLSVGPTTPAELPAGSGWLIKIKNVFATMADSIEFSKCFNGSDIYATTDACRIEYNNSTGNANAKQVVLNWESLEQGIIPVILEVQIEPNLPQGTEIAFRARSKAKVDNEDAESAEMRKIFKIGEPTCLNTFGFAWQPVLTDSFSNRINLPANPSDPAAATKIANPGEYTLDYVIDNCGNADYQAGLNADNIADATGTADTALSLSTGTGTGTASITVFENKFFTANSQISSLENSAEFPEIKIVSSHNADLTAVRMKLETQPVSDSSSEYIIFFNVSGRKQLAVDYPAKVLREDFMQIGGQVRDGSPDGTGAPVANAVVKITKKDGSFAADVTRTDGIFLVNLSIADIEGMDTAELSVQASNYDEFTGTIEFTDDPPYTEFNEQFKCVQINNEPLIAEDDQGLLRPTEKILDLKATDSFAQAKILTVNCAESVVVYLVPSGAVQAKAKLGIIDGIEGEGGEWHATFNPTDAGKIGIIGSTENIQGEFPVLVKARFASQPAGTESQQIIGTVTAQFTENPANNCISIEDDKFRYEVTSDSVESAFANSCSVTAGTEVYPIVDAGELQSRGSFSFDRSGSADSTPISINWNYSFVKENCTEEPCSKADSGPITINPTAGSVQTITSIKPENFAMFDTDKIVAYSAVSDSDKATVYLDAKDKSLKAVLNPVKHERFGFTISKGSLSTNKYLLASYEDYLSPEVLVSSSGKVTAGGTINAYNALGTKIGSGEPIPEQQIAADGAQHIVKDSIGGIGGAQARFYTVSSSNRETKILFKSGNTLSNVSFNKEDKVVAIPIDFANRALSKNIDLVFVADTSASMVSIWNGNDSGICSQISRTINDLTSMDFNVTAKIYFIGLDASSSELPEAMKTGCGGELQVAGKAEWGGAKDIFISSGETNGGYDHDQESWSPAMQYVLANDQIFTDPAFDGHNKIVVAVVDNDPTGKKCQKFYEQYTGAGNCDIQWRLDAPDGQPNIINELEFKDAAVSAANSKKAKLFFLYGFPINHDYIMNEYTGPGFSGLNDVFEIYDATARETNGIAVAYGGETGVNPGNERLLQAILAASLPVSLEQKFQLKVDVGKSGQCFLNGVQGFSGTDSIYIPRVKYSWGWEGISSTQCDSSNPDFVYCDQTQFYVSLAKKIYDISTWGKEANDEEAKTGILGHSSEVLAYRNFDAYLIEDTYTQKFKTDFVAFYSTYESLLSMFKNESEPWGLYLQDTAKFKVFVNEVLVNTAVSGIPLKAGLYHVSIAFKPVNPSSAFNWIFFQNREPITITEVRLTFIKEPDFDTPLYHLPVDGLIGIEPSGSVTGGRSQYGVKFVPASGVNFTINQGIDSQQVANGKISVDLLQEKDFEVLNASGKLLSVDFDAASIKPNSITAMIPNSAMPVVAKVSSSNRKAVLDYFVFDETASLKIGEGSDSMNSWNLFASTIDDTCTDFAENIWMPQDDSSGDSWEPKANDVANCSPTTFGYYWPSAANDNDIYLKTVFYSSPNSSIQLKKSCQYYKNTEYAVKSSFYGLDSSGNSTAPMKTINGSPVSLSRTSAERYEFAIDQLAQIFEKIKSDEVCVSMNKNSGKLEFWWNREKIENFLSDQLNIGNADRCG